MAFVQSPYHYLTTFLLQLGLALLTITISAQDSSPTSVKSLPQEEIKDLKELAKYDKTVKKLRPKNRQNSNSKKEEKAQVEEAETETPEVSVSSGLGPIFTGLLYVIIAALVIFILFTIFSSIKIDKKLKKEPVSTQEEIEDIEVIDAESGLDLALKAGNFREAVRMLFIKLLQILVIENSIEWKPEKTNRDYLREMNSHPKIHHFNNLVIAYERIWYGSEPIDEPFFEYLRADFEKFYSTENVNIDVKE